MLQYLGQTKDSIAIVCIDHAGLTTNVPNLLNFLQYVKDTASSEHHKSINLLLCCCTYRTYESVKFIIVDNLEARNTVDTFSRETLLTDPGAAKKFNSRPGPIKRSKAV